MNKPTLSICIPTNSRFDILEKTVQSIYNEPGLDYSEFEIIVSDNSNSDDIFQYFQKFRSISNFKIVKSNSVGFLNSVNALKHGNGHYLKLHNNYSLFNKNSLFEIVAFLKTLKNNNYTIHFDNNKNKKSNKVFCFESFDSFLKDISFLSSWSNTFCISREQFLNIDLNKCDKMFPHTSLLLTQYNSKKYCTYKDSLFTNLEVKSKGGYDIFKTFAVDFLNLYDFAVKEKHVSKSTFLHVKFNLYTKFLIKWYCDLIYFKNEYTFIISGVKDSICIHYNLFFYYLLLFISFFRAKLKLLKCLISKLRDN